MYICQELQYIHICPFIEFFSKITNDVHKYLCMSCLSQCYIKQINKLNNTNKALANPCFIHPRDYHAVVEA